MWQGDILLLSAGTEVAADARILFAVQVDVNESRLSGETFPVHKALALDGPPPPLLADTPLAERSNMLFSGSVLTRGRARALVVSTGNETELGVITASANRYGSKDSRTSLQQLLKRVASTLTWVALVSSVLGGLLGLTKSFEWQEVNI